MLPKCVENYRGETKPKQGDHEIANFNRPISLLPILSKVCERVAHNQLMGYLTSKGRLSKLQVCGSKLGVAKTRNFKPSFLGKQLFQVEAVRDLLTIMALQLSLLVCRD